MTHVEEVFVEAVLLQHFERLDGAAPCVVLAHQVRHNFRYVGAELLLGKQPCLQLDVIAAGGARWTQLSVRPVLVAEQMEVVDKHRFRVDPVDQIAELPVCERMR